MCRLICVACAYGGRIAATGRQLIGCNRLFRCNLRLEGTFLALAKQTEPAKMVHAVLGVKCWGSKAHGHFSGCPFLLITGSIYITSANVHGICGAFWALYTAFAVLKNIAQSVGALRPRGIFGSAHIS